MGGEKPPTSEIYDPIRRIQSLSIKWKSADPFEWRLQGYPKGRGVTMPSRNPRIHFGHETYEENSPP